MELQLNGPSEKLDGPFSVTGILILRHRSDKIRRIRITRMTHTPRDVTFLLIAL